MYLQMKKLRCGEVSNWMLTQVLREKGKICLTQDINFSGEEDLRGIMSLILYMLTFISL